MHKIKAKGILSSQNGMNIYRGCTHGCIYCDAQHFPGMKEKYIRTYGNAYELPVPEEKKLWQLLTEECKRAGMEYHTEKLFAYMRAFEDKQAGCQLSLFE